MRVTGSFQGTRRGDARRRARCPGGAHWRASGLVLLVALLLPAGPRVGAALTETVAAELARQLGNAHLSVGDHRVDLAELSGFYAARDHRPLWLAEDGGRARADQMLAALAQATREGLDPDDYAIAEIEALSGRAAPEDLARLDLLLTHALLHYASDLRSGRRATRELDPELFIKPGRIDRLGILEGALASEDLAAYLRDLAPSNPVYRRLRRALAEYRDMAKAGGWPTLADGPSLKEGMRGPAVATLRRRLELSGDLTVTADEPALFDAPLRQAVERFQDRHGLEQDGVVGPNTRAGLNVPLKARTEQILVNMERWRWMPDDLGERYVLVNLAGFEVDVVEDGSVVLAMRAIVGRPYRRSPVFTGRMTYLVFNPTWTVPPSIARLDILPKVREDPSYLPANNIRVLDGWDSNARELDPFRIDWRAVNPRRIPYVLRQDPGPTNALGRVKFMFPNEFNVYLHDTPTRELFQRTVRTFSSGCIRVEKPLELAEYLLSADPTWTRARMEAVIATGKSVNVSLPRPLPVHLTYSTVWFGEGGTIHFRDDVYGRDAIIRRALFGDR